MSGQTFVLVGLAVALGAAPAALLVPAGAAPAAIGGAPRGKAWSSCTGTDPAGVIAGCTAVLARGDVVPKADQATALDSRAAVYESRGDHDRALADLDYELRLFPNKSAIYRNVGLVHSAQGHDRKAIADYSKAIELDPEAEKAYSDRCLSYQAEGDYKAAIADCDRAIRLDPDDSRAYLNRGLAHRRQAPGLRLERWRRKEYGLAIADFGQALRLDPRFAGAYFDRGLTYESEGRFSRARADIAKMLALSPSDPGGQAARTRLANERAHHR